MTPRRPLLLAAVLGASGVALGAYRAHGLDRWLERVAPPEDVAKRLEHAQTAVTYQLFHALALLALAALLAQRPSRALRAAVGLFTLGVVLFSGGLYLNVFAGTLGHWAIVPSGGLCLIAGWVAVGAAALRRWDAGA